MRDRVAASHAGAPSTVVFTVGFGDVFRHYGACGCRSILHAYGDALRALLVATDAATARTPRPPPLGDARVELVPLLSAPTGNQSAWLLQMFALRELLGLVRRKFRGAHAVYTDLDVLHTRPAFDAALLGDAPFTVGVLARPPKLEGALNVGLLLFPAAATRKAHALLAVAYDLYAKFYGGLRS